MMYKQALVIITVLIAVGAAWARAQQVRDATITGQISDPVAGKCTETGYAAICPSGPLNCSCITINAAKVKGSLAGDGIGVVRFTVDSGSSTSAVPGATCQPAFGVADLTTVTGRGVNKTTKTETLNSLAAICDKLHGGRPDTFTGGFGIAASPDQARRRAGGEPLTAAKRARR